MTPQQKDSRLMIGQRIDVFEVIAAPGYGQKFMPTGSHRIGYDWLTFGADLIADNHGNTLYLSYKADFDNRCRKVGTLVVTKLKGEDGV